MKKVVLIALVISMLVSIFAACGKTETDTAANTTAAANSQAAQTTVERTPDDYKLEEYPDVMKLSVYYAGGCNPAASPDNITTKYFMEKFKIDLTDVTWPAGEDTASKISMMAAAGDMPDVVQYFNDAAKDPIGKLSDAGMLVPLDDMIAKYMPNFSSYNSPELLNYFRSAKDGKLYKLPSFTVTPETAEKMITINSTPIIRKDILEKAGKQTPKTPEEFYELLKAIKALGIKDVVPYASISDQGSDIDSTLGHMFGFPAYQISVDDNSQRILFNYNQPQYLDYIKYVAKLYRENLVNQDLFIAKRDQIIEKVKAGQVAASITVPGWVTDWFQPALKAKNIPSDFVPFTMPRPAGVEKTNWYVYSPFGWSQSAISNKAKDPVRIAKFIDWMYTHEGNAIAMRGAPSKEDNIWYEENGEWILNLDLKAKVAAGTVKQNPGGWTYWINLPGYHADNDPLQIAKGGEVRFGGFNKLSHDLNSADIYSDLKIEKYSISPKGPIYKEKFTNIETLYKKWRAEIVMRTKSDAEVEQKYAQMIQELEKAGLVEVEKENYQIYQQANSK